MQRRLRCSGQLQVVDFTNCHKLRYESVLATWRRKLQSETYRNSSRLRHVDEFPRQEDSIDLFRCAEAASFHSPFCVQTRGSVTGDVTCPQSYGNATLAGIPQHLLRRIQSVMNAAVRLIYSSSRFGLVVQSLMTSLVLSRTVTRHWPVFQRPEMTDHWRGIIYIYIYIYIYI